MIALWIALAVGILAYILFVMLVPKALPSASDDRLRDALDRLQAENRALANEQRDIMRGSLLEESALMRIIFGSALFTPLYEKAVQAGYQERLPQLLTRMGVYALIGLFLMLQLQLPVAVLLLVLPITYLLILRHCDRVVRRRNAQFINQFPDALETIVRSVRSGFPLSVALQMLAENAEEPVRSQFQQVVEEVALGRSLQQALVRMAARISEPDVRFFVVVIGVQQETGGNLAEIIGNLATIIRKRKQLRHKIRALTAEGKATGWVLGMLPVVVFTAIYFMQPGYLAPFFNDPLGQMLFAGALSLLFVCFIVVREMIRVDI